MSREEVVCCKEDFNHLSVYGNSCLRCAVVDKSTLVLEVNISLLVHLTASNAISFVLKVQTLSSSLSNLIYYLNFSKWRNRRWSACQTMRCHIPHGKKMGHVTITTRTTPSCYLPRICISNLKFKIFSLRESV